MLLWLSEGSERGCFLTVLCTEDSPKLTKVHGDCDDVVPYNGALLMSQAVPGSKLVTIKGAKHGIAANGECQRAVRMWLDAYEAMPLSKARL